MRNTGLKIVSVIMAVLLWFYVINQGDLTPRQNIVTTNLRYVNLEEGLSIILPETVQVKLWGLYQEPEEVIAYVDVNNLDIGTYELPVIVEPVKGALFTTVEPDTVEVTIKAESEKSIPITHVITRNPGVGYELLDVMKNPDQCLIKGEESLVNKVSQVVCEIDLADITGIESITVPLKAVDSQGQPITKGIRLVPEKINLYVVVNQAMVTKQVPVRLSVTGTLPEGHQLLSAKLTVEAVRIIAPAALADAINELETKKLDINGKVESFSQELEIIAPQGVNVYPNKVMVDVNIAAPVDDDFDD